MVTTDLTLPREREVFTPWSNDNVVHASSSSLHVSFFLIPLTKPKTRSYNSACLPIYNVFQNKFYIIFTIILR